MMVKNSYDFHKEIVELDKMVLIFPIAFASRSLIETRTRVPYFIGITLETPDSKAPRIQENHVTLQKKPDNVTVVSKPFKNKKNPPCKTLTQP